MDKLTVKELLGTNVFDPMSVDTSEIKELACALPRDGNIDLNNAEVLAAKYLRGADVCAELLAIATSHVHKTDALKKRAFSTAALVKSQAAGCKTDKSKSWFAEMDDDYIQACNNHGDAVAFVKWVSSKYDSFIKMHYLCRNIVKRGMDHEGASGWETKNFSNEEMGVEKKDDFSWDDM